MTSARATQRAVRTGLTLLELLIVVTVIALWGRVAMPRVAESLARRRVAATVDRITRDLEWARRVAATTSASVSVVFNPTLDRYTVTQSANTLPQSRLTVVNLASAPYKADLSSVNFCASTGGCGATVVFNGYGSTSYSGTALVRVGKVAQYVVLDGSTGRVYTP